MTTKNERSVDRELPEQNVQPRTGRQTRGDIHQVRGDPPGLNLGRRAGQATSGEHFSIQETSHVHRALGRAGQATSEQQFLFSIQETGGNVHRVMCLISGDIELNQPLVLDLARRERQGNMETVTGIQETGDVHCMNRGNPGTFFDQCGVSTVM